MTYKDALTLAMARLAEDSRILFVGQTVVYGGQTMFPTFRDVPMEKRIELPVAEEFQMGFCTGLALEGFIPISVYPRWDFLLLAANQLVNHLDKLPLMGDFRPKVIIRTAVGPKVPLDAGPQHTQNHTEAFRLILKTVEVLEITTADKVLGTYAYALSCPGSALVIEHLEKYLA